MLLLITSKETFKKTNKKNWTHPESNRGPLPLRRSHDSICEMLREYYTTKPCALVDI